MYDLIIIGAGPAGLSAAVYGKRAGLDLLVIEQTPMGGGQVVNTYEVDNYLGLPSINGFDLAQKFRQHADGMGAVFQTGKVAQINDDGEKKSVELTDGTVFEARTLILAGGAEHAKLGVPGEEM
ncbi:MAG: NAD(P)/FAD-dependent oxidoreductase, partial [Lachnospiraceae bacterium]|nr:NAD(P)/FAD-dependent oxidoreductase [Lachnospiraceae bacterium]